MKDLKPEQWRGRLNDLGRLWPSSVLTDDLRVQPDGSLLIVDRDGRTRTAQPGDYIKVRGGRLIVARLHESPDGDSKGAV